MKIKTLIKSLKNYELAKRSNKQKELKQQLEFLENLDLFLQRGYSLVEAFSILNNRFKLESQIEQLRQGKLLSEVFKELNYDNDVLLILEISELSGNMKGGVNRTIMLLQNKIASKDQLLEVIKYPLLLAAILIVALGFVSLFLIPQFVQIYDSFGIELNLLVKSIFTLIKVLPVITIIILLSIIIIIIIINQLELDKKIKILLQYDVIAKNYIKLYNQIFVINIANLLNMGLRLDDILKILQKQDYNILIKREASRILTELRQGSSLYKAVQTELYSDELIALIKDGEAQSTLVHNLENYILFTEKERKHKTEQMLFLIQPIFYAIFGLLIIMLYVSIFMPMYQMMDAL